MHRFLIFLWHTLTRARLNTEQKWLLLAWLGLYVLKTHSTIQWKEQFFGHVLTVNCPFAAMSCKVQLNTLQGGVITLDVAMTATVRELKAVLVEKHPCQDPIECKVLKVELLGDTSIIDDAETLDAAGLLGAESLVTVTYTRNEVEAATKHDIRTQGSFAVKIPSNVTSIPKGAFQDSRQLVLLTIPESVTCIGDSAFEGCISLASITWGESVTQIGDGAFYGCTSLASVTLGQSVTEIGEDAFQDCTSLASITGGESVTYIGSAAFDGCTSLASITLGESVTHIGDHSFCGCTSLASITWGESVTRIGQCAFRFCTFSGEHHRGWVCDLHWVRCLWWVHFSCEHHFGRVCDSHWRSFLLWVHFSGKHHRGWVCDLHWVRCLWWVHFSCEHHFGRVCDSHWRSFLLWVHFSGKHHLGWVCHSHWARCLSILHFSGEHHLGSVCDSRWGPCLWRLHLSGEHHLGSVCDSRWGQCLWRLHFSGEHHNWAKVMWGKLGEESLLRRLHLSWQSSPFLQGQGSDSRLRDSAFEGCTPVASITLGQSDDSRWGHCLWRLQLCWRAKTSVSLWLTLGTVTLKAALLWCSPQFQWHWGFLAAHQY